MNLWIPDLTEQIVLTEPFYVNIEWERRNFPLIKSRFPELVKQHNNLQAKWYAAWSLINKTPEGEAFSNFLKANQYKDFTFPKGTIFEVDRIYIRKGATDFSSVTFKIREKNKVLRFWIKLGDVNRIVGEPIGKKIQYPNGRFCLVVREPYSYSEHSGRCKPYSKYILKFQTSSSYFTVSNDENNNVVHNTRSSGFASDYTSYDSLDKLITAANKKNFPSHVIEAFKKKLLDKSDKNH